MVDGDMPAAAITSLSTKFLTQLCRLRFPRLNSQQQSARAKGDAWQVCDDGNSSLYNKWQR